MKEKNIPARMRLLLEDYVKMLARTRGAMNPKLEESSDGDMIITDFAHTGRTFMVKIEEII